ncbi:MAG: homocysteine S-methyltransferase family protein [Planctomycetota bacterium]|jgi:5-methyltetrahydrofolate--homocysteine methyltransferase
MVAKVFAEDFLGKVTVADGAWGTELDKLGCPPGYCREEWNITKPELVEQVASSYLAAGAEIILTNTLGANRFVLGSHGHADQVAAFNRAGAEISKRAATDAAGPGVPGGTGGLPASVFGSIGPSGKMLVMGDVKEDELFEAFKVQAEALAEGGADALVVETMFDLTEAMAAVRAAKSTGLLVVGSMTFDSGKDKTCTMMGVTPERAVEALTEAGADIFGCNCGIGIENYINVAAKLRAATTQPVWVKANAGMPEVKGDQVVYDMKPGEYAQQVVRVVEAGANIVGGCCGTSPEFIAAICQALSEREERAAGCSAAPCGRRSPRGSA